MNLVKLSVPSPGSGFRQLYKGSAEVALLTHPNLVSLFDPAYAGYRTLNTNGKLLGTKNVRQPGKLFQGNVTLDSALTVPGMIDGVAVVDKTDASGNARNYKDDYSYPAGDFTYFGAWSLNTGSGQNAYTLGTFDAGGFTVGCSTDYKPRVYSRYPGTVLVSSTADIVEGRMSLFVAQYTVGSNNIKLWVDGVKRIDASPALAVNQTVRRLIVGSTFYNDGTDHDLSGAMKGYIGFAGVMSGADSSYVTVLRDFAKERFPAALSHVV